MAKHVSRKVIHNQNKLSRRRKISLLIQSVLLWCKILFTIIAVVMYWIYKDKIIINIQNYFYRATLDIGCKLNNIIIDDRHYADIDNVIQQLQTYNQKSILSINLENIRAEIIKNPFIKEAIIVRILPHTIHIKLIEKKPIAVWQINQKLNLIDEDGDIITSIDSITLAQNFNAILHVVGDNANIYAADLINLLELCPSIKGIVIAATRFGDRRWDLNLCNNIKVKLPETNIDAAMHYLNTLYDDGSLFDSNIKTIDIRNNKRCYFEYHASVPK